MPKKQTQHKKYTYGSAEMTTSLRYGYLLRSNNSLQPNYSVFRYDSSVVVLKIFYNLRILACSTTPLIVCLVAKTNREILVQIHLHLAFHRQHIMIVQVVSFKLLPQGVHAGVGRSI